MKKLIKRKKISENFILNNYFQKLNHNQKETFNFKNDGALIKTFKNEKIIVTNDTIVENIDFFSEDPPESIAQKIVCYNLSDISSMGATPYCYSLSICLPTKITTQWLKRFSKKIYFLQKKYNFFLLGGDISKSNEIVISASYYGKLKKGKVLERINSKIHDDIWLTGNLGDSSIGLAIKKNKLSVDSNMKKYFINKYLFPEPCLIGNKINKIASSAIDISDGFLGDLEKIIFDRNLGAFIEMNKIPLSKYLKDLIKNKKIDLNYILTSGDDYQILFTSNLKNRSLIKNISQKNNIKISRIGIILKNEGIYIGGKKYNNLNKSYKHFF